MNELYSYLLEGLDLTEKTVLDAAVGAGRATRRLAEEADRQGGTSRVIAIDNELPKTWIGSIRTRLGPYARYVELRQADIFDLASIESGSIDIVNCHDTIVFLNPRPLKLLGALGEFRRVLKPDGLLLTTSELPLENDRPENEGQWRRWNLAKAISDLKGATWATEPLPEELKAALELQGMRVYDERAFPARRSSDYRDTIAEWRELMLADAAALPSDPDLRDALVREIDRVCHKIRTDGFLMCPARYVLKCRKLA